MADPAVRGLHGAATIPGCAAPYASLHWRADFPAAAASTADAVTGIIGPDPGRMPLGICVLHPNFSCGPELYGWLARSLALAGWCAVRFSWVAPGIDGTPLLSTGIDLGRIDDAPNAVLVPLLEALAASVIGPALDRDRVALVGHSAGGTVALLTSHPALRASVSYGGHVLVPGGRTLRMEPGPARLVIGGTHDGIVGTLTGTQGSALAKLQATVAAAPSPAMLCVVDGADHYAVCEGYDGSTGRGHLEAPGPRPADEVRAEVSELVLAWLAEHAPPSR